jgi:hypothetical protein
MSLGKLAASLVAGIAVGGLILAAQPRESPAPAINPPFEISLTPILPLSVDNPQIDVKYCNASQISNLTIHPPVNEYQGPMADYCGLQVFIDARAASVRHAIHGDVISPPGHLLRPLATKVLSFPLKRSCSIPVDWNQLEVRLPSCWGLRGTTLAFFKLERKVHNPAVAPSGLETGVKAELPIDPLSPRIIIRYANADTKNGIPYFLPAGFEAHRFRGIAVRIDGVPAKFLIPDEELRRLPAMNKWPQTLEPRESVEYHLDLSRLISIPLGWKRLEVSAPKLAEVESTVIGSLILERPVLKSLYGNTTPPKP